MRQKGRNDLSIFLYSKEGQSFKLSQSGVFQFWDNCIPILG